MTTQNNNKTKLTQDAQWKEMSEVFKNTLEKNGLTIKECGFLNARREFVKGTELETKMKENIEPLCKKINEIMNTDIDPNSKDAIQKIYNQFKSSDIMVKACREEGDKKKIIRRLFPYEHLCRQHGCNCGMDHDQTERDHPKNYSPEEVKKFDPSFYYILNINRSMRTIYMYLILIIAAILIYALMPIWPYKMKLVVWWVSYILLIILVTIYVVRLAVYLFFYIFGYDVWIFPDINNDKLGFVDSFKKVISWDKRNESWITISIRIVIASITGYIAFCIYKNPGLIDDAKNVVIDALKDFYIFGEDKFVNSWNSTAVSLKYKTKSIDELNDLI